MKSADVLLVISILLLRFENTRGVVGVIPGVNIQFPKTVPHSLPKYNIAVDWLASVLLAIAILNWSTVISHPLAVTLNLWEEWWL